MAEFAAEIKELGDKIVGLTLKQAVELAAYLKETYNIEPAAGGAVMMAGPAAGGDLVGGEVGGGAVAGAPTEAGEAAGAGRGAVAGGDGAASWGRETWGAWTGADVRAWRNRRSSAKISCCASRILSRIVSMGRL